MCMIRRCGICVQCASPRRHCGAMDPWDEYTPFWWGESVGVLFVSGPTAALYVYKISTSALRAAKACQRDKVIPGDGCAAPTHKPKPRNVARFITTQARWTADVAAGRPVVAWPETRTQHLLQVISPLTGWESD